MKFNKLILLIALCAMMPIISMERQVTVRVNFDGKLIDTQVKENIRLDALSLIKAEEQQPGYTPINIGDFLTVHCYPNLFRCDEKTVDRILGANPRVTLLNMTLSSPIHWCANWGRRKLHIHITQYKAGSETALQERSYFSYELALKTKIIATAAAVGAIACAGSILKKLLK